MTRSSTGRAKFDRDELVRQWCAKADEDIEAARILANCEPVVPYPMAYHAHEAAKKYLKAFLVSYNVELPEVDDFEEILKLVDTANAKLAPENGELSELGPYSLACGYPGDFPTPSVDQAKRALVVAESAQEEILRRLDD